MKSRLITLAVAICALVFHGLYFDQGIKNLVDLGVAAVDSERILHGEVFGKDFIAPYGPGRYYLVAGVFSIFGCSMTVLCGVFWMLRVLVDVGTFLLARRLLPWLPALGVVLCVALAHGPTHKGFLTSGTVVLLLASTLAYDRPTWRHCFLLGGVVSIAGAFRYDLGVLGLIIAFMVMVRAAHWKSFLAGLTLFALPTLLILLSGDPMGLVESEISRADLLKDAQSRAVHSSSATVLSLILLAGPPMMLLFLLYQRMRKNRSTDAVIWLVTALMGLFLFSQYAIEPKINRLLQVSPALFLCLFYLAHRIPPRYVLPTLLVGITGWYVASDSGQGSIDSVAVLMRDQVPIEGERAGFSCSPRLAEGIGASLRWIENHGTFYASPSVPLLYFLAGKENPAPVTDFTYLLGNEKMQRIVIDRLEEKRVDCYLLRPALIQGFDPREKAPLLSTYLKVEYVRRIPLAAGFEVYLR